MTAPALSAAVPSDSGAAFDGRSRFLKLFISFALTIMRSKGRLLRHEGFGAAKFKMRQQKAGLRAGYFARHSFGGSENLSSARPPEEAGRRFCVIGDGRKMSRMKRCPLRDK